MHFMAFVIGQNIEKQLAPYQEFECSDGMVEDYIQSIDVTKEHLEQYKTYKFRRYVDEKGNVFDPYSDQFYREPTPEELQIILRKACNSNISFAYKQWGDVDGESSYRVHYLPEGFEAKELDASEIYTFYEFIKAQGYKTLQMNETPHFGTGESHMWGWCQVDENNEVVQVIDRTNPNCKWDYWLVGGRFSGWLSYKDTLDRTLYEEDAYIPVKHIDFEVLQNEAEVEARAAYRSLVSLLGSPLPPIEISWEDLCADTTKTWEERRDKYFSQKPIEAYKLAQKDNPDLNFSLYDDFASCTEEEYVARARNNACTPNVIVKDGVWYALGENSWWDSASPKVDSKEWSEHVVKFLTSLDPDEVITIVDCHI